MLKELGWSEAELKRFVDRWQQRKAAAEQKNEAGDAAKRELDDALRSLGLRPGELQQNAVQKDRCAICTKGIAVRCRPSIRIGCGRITRGVAGAGRWKPRGCG